MRWGGQHPRLPISVLLGEWSQVACCLLCVWESERCVWKRGVSKYLCAAIGWLSEWNGTELGVSWVEVHMQVNWWWCTNGWVNGTELGVSWVVQVGKWTLCVSVAWMSTFVRWKLKVEFHIEVRIGDAWMVEWMEQSWVNWVVQVGKLTLCVSVAWMSTFVRWKLKGKNFGSAWSCVGGKVELLIQFGEYLHTPLPGISGPLFLLQAVGVQNWLGWVSEWVREIISMKCQF